MLDPESRVPYRAGMVARSLLLLLALLMAVPASAQEPATDSPAPNATAVPNPSGLPIPRFVSLRTSEINLRTGPVNIESINNGPERSYLCCYIYNTASYHVR